MTVLDLITSSMRLLGVLTQGQLPNNSEAQDCFNRLNDLIDTWNTNRFNIYQIAQQTLAIAVTKQSYQIGPSAVDYPNLLRPVLIQNAILRVNYGTTVELPLDIITATEYSAISEKFQTGFIPKKLYNDYGFPISSLYLWPLPQGTPIIVLYVWLALTGYVALTDTVSLPPGYLKAIQYNLAIDISSEFGVPVPQSVVAIAGDAKTGMMGLNKSLVDGAQFQMPSMPSPQVGFPKTGVDLQGTAPVPPPAPGGQQ